MRLRLDGCVANTKKNFIVHASSIVLFKPGQKCSRSTMSHDFGSVYFACLDKPLCNILNAMGAVSDMNKREAQMHGILNLIKHGLRVF